jgi:hypothetical protein
MMGNLGEGFFTWIPKDMLNKARERGPASIRAPFLENMKGRFFLRAFPI